MSKTRKILISVLLVCFVVFGYLFISEEQKMRKEQKVFEELLQTVTETVKETGEQDKTDTYSDPVMLPQYQELYKKNQEFFGWIKLEGCKIDYPVMYTPMDPEKYLHLDFNSNYSFAGVPFLDAKCKADGNSYIIYGHNMANGTMFGRLKNYSDKSFWEENKEIQFDTLYDSNRYTIFASGRILLGVNDNQFEYYGYTNLSDESVFNDFIARVKSCAMYDTELTPEFGDEILMLSTCSGYADSERMVVFAYNPCGRENPRF